MEQAKGKLSSQNQYRHRFLIDLRLAEGKAQARKEVQERGWTEVWEEGLAEALEMVEAEVEAEVEEETKKG